MFKCTAFKWYWSLTHLLNNAYGVSPWSIRNQVNSSHRSNCYRSLHCVANFALETMKITHNPSMIMKLMVCTSFTLLVANCVLLAHQYQVVENFVSKSVYLNDSKLLFTSFIFNTHCEDGKRMIHTLRSYQSTSNKLPWPQSQMIASLLLTTKLGHIHSLRSVALFDWDPRVGHSRSPSTINCIAWMLSDFLIPLRGMG